MLPGGMHGDSHPGVELRANLKSISHRCHLFEVAFVWELTKETIDLPLGCLKGGVGINEVSICNPVRSCFSAGVPRS